MGFLKIRPVYSFTSSPGPGFIFSQILEMKLIFFSFSGLCQSKWIKRQLKLRGSRWSLCFGCRTFWTLVSIDIPCLFS
uniref:Uncharacterized protein n=1 Tax=Brassica oleracea TaxID=3712 RepID=A0A3P6GYV8_BRAOL|nr:unnamed protein product [Brassica oleracea]